MVLAQTVKIPSCGGEEKGVQTKCDITFIFLLLRLRLEKKGGGSQKWGDT